MISVCTCSSTQHPDLRRLRTMRFCSERYDTNRCSTVPFSAQLFCYFVLVLLLNYQAGLAHPPIILGRGDSHPEEQVQPTNYLMRRWRPSWIGGSTHPLSYEEVKAILKNKFRTDLRNQLHLGLEEDAWRLSDSAKEVIFQLRNGHCQLLAHLYKLGLFPTDKCPCSTDIQTLEHLL